MTRRKWIVVGLASLLLVSIIVVIISAPAALALRLAGFRAQGQTGDFLLDESAGRQPTIQWVDSTAWSTPTPIVTPGSTQNGGNDSMTDSTLASTAPDSVAIPEPLNEIKVDIWFLTRPETFRSSEIFTRRMERRQTDDGQVAYYIEFNQEGVNTYLDTWFGAYLESEPSVRNAWIDLKPGGVVIYADINLELGWQTAGAVFMLDASGRQLVLAGVDIEGTLYSTPPDGQIALMLQQLETEANRALADLTFLDSSGSLGIQTINLDEDSVRILAY